MALESSAAERDHRRGWWRRLSTTAIDQALSGGSNALTTILAARALDVTSFGEFGIVFMFFMLGQAVPRSLIGQPLLIHPEEADRKPGEALGSGIAIGAATGALITMIGVGAIAASSDDLGLAMLILGISFPFLVLQDTGRFIGFATRRPGVAVLLDVVWLVLMVVGIVGGDAVIDLGLPALVFAWVASGAVGGVMVLWQHRAQHIRIALTWVRATWEYSWRFLVSAATNQGGLMIGALVFAAIAGAAALGALVGALVLLRPFMAANIAAITAGTAEVARERPNSHDLRESAGRLSLIAGAIALVNGVVLLLLPTSIGELLLGDTWSSTQELLVPAAISVIFMGLKTGPRAGLLGDRAVHKALLLDLRLTPIMVVVACAGGALDGALGYYWGLVAAQALISGAWWVSFLRHSSTDPRETERGAPEPPAGAGGRATGTWTAPEPAAAPPGTYPGGVAMTGPGSRTGRAR